MKEGGSDLGLRTVAPCVAVLGLGLPDVSGVPEIDGLVQSLAGSLCASYRFPPKGGRRFVASNTGTISCCY